MNAPGPPGVASWAATPQSGRRVEATDVRWRKVGAMTTSTVGGVSAAFREVTSALTEARVPFCRREGKEGKVRVRGRIAGRPRLFSFGCHARAGSPTYGSASVFVFCSVCPRLSHSPPSSCRLCEPSW